MKTLRNKVAIITGASSGIGKATALLFAEEGAMVIASDIDGNQGLEVVKEITAKDGNAFFIKADTSKPEDNWNLVQETVRLFGKLDIAVNNAGIGGPLMSTADYPIDEWQKVIDINLSGVFYGMKYQIPEMSLRGGSIVNVSSALGQTAKKLTPAYIAAKHGVVGLTKAAAVDHAEQEIRINAIGPGYINAPLIREMDAETLSAITAFHPIGRLQEAKEVAELILWIVSDRSSFATGAYYPIDGVDEVIPVSQLHRIMKRSLN